MKLTPINKILPTSMVDGPGNRTAIFLQTCNISCIYCHNPETQKMCLHCGLCVEKCPSGALSFSDDHKVIWDEELCALCDTCIKVCTNNSSPRIRMMTAESVFEEVKKNIPFIRGITVSGGECTLYPEFLKELFRLAKTVNLSCLIDGNGTIDLSLYPDLIYYCDGVMLDVKSWDSKTFKNLTGGDNLIVKKNLKFLADNGKLEEIRIVCLPGEVDAEEVIKGSADTLGHKNMDIRLKLIKFRRFGVKGRLEKVQSPDDVYMEGLRKQAVDLGFKNVIIT